MHLLTAYGGISSSWQATAKGTRNAGGCEIPRARGCRACSEEEASKQLFSSASATTFLATATVPLPSAGQQMTDRLHADCRACTAMHASLLLLPTVAAFLQRRIGQSTAKLVPPFSKF